MIEFPAVPAADHIRVQIEEFIREPGNLIREEAQHTVRCKSCLHICFREICKEAVSGIDLHNGISRILLFYPPVKEAYGIV